MSKSSLIFVFLFGLAIGYGLSDVLNLASPDKLETVTTTTTTTLDSNTCETLCTTAIKAMTYIAYVDSKVDLLLKTARLVPKTELACHRICLLPALQSCVANILADPGLAINQDL